MAVSKGISEQLAAIQEAQREHGEWIGLIGADVREMHNWLAEAGLNDTGDGRRRLNELLAEDRAKDTRQERRNVALDYFFGGTWRAVKGAKPLTKVVGLVAFGSSTVWFLSGLISILKSLQPR